MNLSAGVHTDLVWPIAITLLVTGGILFLLGVPLVVFRAIGLGRSITPGASGASGAGTSGPGAAAAGMATTDTMRVGGGTSASVSVAGCWFFSGSGSSSRRSWRSLRSRSRAGTRSRCSTSTRAFQVVAYAALMRDEYPPFRLDQGPTEPDPEPALSDTA